MPLPRSRNDTRKKTVEHVWNTCGTRVAHVWNTCGTRTGFMRRISFAYLEQLQGPKHVSWVCQNVEETHVSEPRLHACQRPCFCRART